MARGSIFAILVVLLTGFAFVATTTVEPVFAQSKRQSAKQRQPGLFERLFGPRQQAPIKVAPMKQRLFTTKKRKTRPRAPAEPGVDTVVVAAKDENARKILVIGDYVAGGIAWGLDQALAKESKIAVINRANNGSGLVRPDHYDWNEALLGILNKEAPDVVVLAFGANDRQQMRESNQRIPIRSPKWEAAYTARIAGIVDSLKVYGRPFFWVSTPPMRSQSVNTDMAWLNTLYEPRVASAGGQFIDIWNGFTNASGQYVASGPDIEGQVRALRTSDGVNFTRAGKLKLAYYVEREIRRRAGIGKGTVNLLASTTQQSTIEIGPDGRKRLVGPIISLSDPLPGASDRLAGDPVPIVYDLATNMVISPPLPDKKPVEETALYKLVVKGEPLTSAPGRIDDFAWPPGERQAQTFEAPGIPEGTVFVPPDAPATAAAGEAVLTPISRSN
jgi:uncharacterized protein